MPQPTAKILAAPLAALHARRRIVILASLAVVWVAGTLGTARAEPLKLEDAAQEAVGVHAMATAAHLCGFMNESDLNRVRIRMDRVHATQLDKSDRETYLILRTSDSFRNRVYRRALSQAHAGCTADLRQMWSEVHASLVFADIANQDKHADLAPPPVAH